jgi:serine phosphatase RsbU (regulator of sigma subunit)
VIDAGVAATMAVVITIAIGVAREPGASIGPQESPARPPDALAYALGLAIAALLLARRRWPVAVLAASVVMLQAYYILNYPAISAAVALAVALYTVAASGRLRWSLLVAGWYWGVGFVVRAFLEPMVGNTEPLTRVLNDLVRDGSLLVAVLLLGDAVHSRQQARESHERELRVAQMIQQQFLPKELPRISGWRISAHYQPARAVGGDFYDVLELPDGRFGLLVGDATDKGVPAALVMATTHSILRGEAPMLVSPGAVLKRVNDRLFPDIPSRMFVTCLYVVLDSATGRLLYSNAGHNLPYVATAGGVTQLQARGMPLGAMPAMEYEEKEAYLGPGDGILLHSDGLVEAHNSAHEMFGLPRLESIVENTGGNNYLIDECLNALTEFAGRDWEQEDDITLMTLRRDI